MEKVTQRRLIEALNEMDVKMTGVSDWSLSQDLQETRRTYQTMLTYMLQGMTDPLQDPLYPQLIQQLHTLNERVDRQARLSTQRGDNYTQSARMISAMTDPSSFIASLETYGRYDHIIHDTAFRNEHDQMAGKLFAWAWTSDQWKKSDAETADQILTSDAIDETDKALLVAGVTIGLLEYFDERRLMFLFDAYLSPHAIASQRALVGVVLCLFRHGDKLGDYRESMARLSLFAEDQRFVRETFIVLEKLQLSKDTDMVNAKMRDEILPEIIKSKHFRRTKFGFEQIDPLLTGDETNPDWEQDSKLRSRIEEMAELQMEGADVNASTFSQLKRYPFFNDIHHWFMPFTIHHPALDDISLLREGEMPSFIQLLLDLDAFCDSDKYSLCYMLKMMPQTQNNTFLQQLVESLDAEGNELFKQKAQQKNKAKDFVKCYLHDLYRFFRIHPNRSQFHNPFGGNACITPLSSPFLNFLHADRERMESYADSMMKKKHFKEAVSLYETLNPRQEKADSQLWQKIAYCYHHNNNPRCLDAYTLADELSEASRWTITHRAQASRLFGDFATAVSCYDRLLETDPDNLRLLQKKGECLAMDERTEEAIAIYQKINYLDGGKPQSLRTLAWLNLKKGDAVKAFGYYSKIATDQRSANDWMNLGHCHLMMKQVEDARQCYHQSQRLFAGENGKATAFEDTFREDAAELRLFPDGNVHLQLFLDALLMG